MKREVAVFGGGCFWCTEAVFSKLKGIQKITSGYAGGKIASPKYEKVSMGTTGHAEVIEIVFDPSSISYPQLLDVFWSVHDPTTLNQQGADVGTQYRSVIFTTSDQQEKQARTSLIQAQKHFSSKIVTEIQPLEKFYTAEQYHQQYYERNKDQPYCSIVISPKLKKVFELHPELFK
jgi:peptide-methionine (S)-S-oxide reductase